MSKASKHPSNKPAGSASANAGRRTKSALVEGKSQATRKVHNPGHYRKPSGAVAPADLKNLTLQDLSRSSLLSPALMELLALEAKARSMDNAVPLDDQDENLTEESDFLYDMPIENKDLQDLEADDKATEQRSLRISPSLLDAMRQAAKNSGVSQQEWMRIQFMKGVKGNAAVETPSGKSIPRSVRFGGLSSSGRVAKKQTALRWEPELEAAVDEAVQEAGVKKNDWLRAALVKALTEGLDVQETLEPSQPSTDLSPSRD